MKFLMDTSPKDLLRRQADHPSLITGQLCTPLTNYANAGGTFAIDNGAYSGLDRAAYFRLLKKHEPNMANCLFVAVPDVVGSSSRTGELYFLFTQMDELTPWTEKWAYVAQDGMQHERINWLGIHHLFIGGTDDFKDSAAAWDIVKTAKALDIPVHVGRVNTLKRYNKYRKLGADTCDGSGIARFDHMLRDIENGLVEEQPLLEDQDNEHAQTDAPCPVPV